VFPSLYAILDLGVTESAGSPSQLPRAEARSTLAFAKELAAAGVSLIQLRDKHASAAKLFAAAREWTQALNPLGARLIINDRPDIAAMVGAGGVHVGQDDVPVEAARAICGPNRWVGVSTHNLDQFRAALGTSADYIAFGPIFPTASKQNPDPVVGLDLFRQSRALTRKPLVAIGGITLDSAADVYRAGADSLAVIRDLARAPDPAARASEYLAIAERVKR
jgi:thiamine-phosphate pyrophosphorylase